MTMSRMKVSILAMTTDVVPMTPRNVCPADITAMTGVHERVIMRRAVITVTSHLVGQRGILMDIRHAMTMHIRLVGTDTRSLVVPVPISIVMPLP